MATENRILQLLRSNRVYAPTGEGENAKTAKQVAKEAVQALTGSKKDGEILLARYQETGGDVKSLICVYHASPSLPSGTTAGWTFIEDASSGDAGLGGLQNEVNQIEASVGLSNVGKYVAPSGSKYLDSTTTVMGALGALDTAVDGIQDAINDLDMNENYSTSSDAVVSDGKVITAVKQVDGQVSALSADFSDVKIAGYTKNTDATGALAATDSLKDAFSKVENAIAKNTVSSTDKTIKINTTGATTDLSVNIDGKTIVAANDGTLSTALKVVKVIPSGTAGADEVVDNSLPANVKEAYRLVYEGSNTAIGKQIEVYKDSSLKSVQLGNPEDTIDANGDIVPAQSPSPETAGQSLNFVYHLADETYQLVQVDVSKFLTDSEFGDGLQVSDGVVSVKKDTNSGKVRTADTPSGVTPDSAEDTGLVDVLTVSSNGVKVDNIQSAINYAVQNASTSLAVSAQGDNVYIAAAVDRTDNKKINVTGTYGVFNTPTAGANTLSADTKGIAKAEDVAAAVNTVVGNLDGEATATAASGNVYTVLTSVTETDGVIDKGGEVTLAAVAKTGAAADVAITDTNNKLTATNVEDALQEIVNKADASLNSVSAGNTGITVSGKDSNNDQVISLNISNATDNILGLDAKNGGIYLSDTWDCGVY